LTEQVLPTTCGHPIDLEVDTLATRLISTVVISEDSQENDPTRETLAITQDCRTSVVTPELLAQRWGISLEVAKKTLNVTTQ
jgi:hypothetical protein